MDLILDLVNRSSHNQCWNGIVRLFNQSDNQSHKLADA